MVELYSMKYFVLFATMVLSLKSFSQFDFKPDPYIFREVNFIGDSSINSNLKQDKLLDSIFKLDKGYDFEFRLWQNSITNKKTVFVITIKQSVISARYFNFYSDSKIDKFQSEEINVDQSKLKQLWYILTSNNVLRLNSETLLTNSMVNYGIDTSNIPYTVSTQRKVLSDGVSYDFELLTPNKTKFYSYTCPITRYKYCPHIESLACASLLIITIQRYLGLPYGC